MKLWTDHGTKIIGGLTAAAGILGAIDPATILAMLTAVFGDRGPGIATTIAGALTIWRGFTNTKKQAT